MLYYRGVGKRARTIKRGDYVTSSFELAALYAIKQSHPAVLVLKGSVVEIPQEEKAYDGEFLAGQMTVTHILVPATSFSSWEDVAMDDYHPLLRKEGWKKL